MSKRHTFVLTGGILSAIGGFSGIGVSASAQTATLNPAKMPSIGTIDERFQSFNIEMVEVTGGRFWKPYDSHAKPEAAPPANANQAGGMSADLYEYRPPIDLSNPRLRKLAKALGPAYLRVSGTWANTTFFQNSEGADKPPEGFKAVLTAREWKGVIDFAKASDADLVTSFATGAGTRDAAGVWTPEEAQKVADFTKAAGGHIAAAEFMNEPTFAELGGARPRGTMQRHTHAISRSSAALQRSLCPTCCCWGLEVWARVRCWLPAGCTRSLRLIFLPRRGRHSMRSRITLTVQSQAVAPRRDRREARQRLLL